MLTRLLASALPLCLCIHSLSAWEDRPVVLPAVTPASHSGIRVETLGPETIATPLASGLTLADVESMALGNNPTLGQAAANVEALQGKWVQAGLYPNPTIGYAAQEVGNEGAGGLHSVFIQKTFVTGGKLGLSQAAAAAEIAKAEEQYNAQRRRVLSDVKIRFFDALVAQRAVKTSQELVDIGRRAQETTSRLVEAREVSRVDLLQSQIAVNAAEVQLARARSKQAQAWRQLASVIGQMDLAPQPLAGDPAADLPRLGWDQAVQFVESGSPQMMAAYAEVDRARWQLDRAIAGAMPNVTVQLAGGYDDASGDNFGGVQVSLPLPIHNKNQGNIAKADAEFVVASQNVERLRLALRNRLAAAYQQHEAALAEVELLEKQKASASDALNLVRAGYPLQFGYLNLTAAQQTYFRAELDYWDAISRLRRSAVLIEGSLLADSLDQQIGN